MKTYCCSAEEYDEDSLGWPREDVHFVTAEVIFLRLIPLLVLSEFVLTIR